MESRTDPFTCPNHFADDTDFGVDQFRGMDLGLGWSACQLSLSHTTRASSPALLWLGHPMLPSAEGRVSSPVFMLSGHFTHTHASKVNATVLPSQVQPVRGWDGSPALTPSGLVHLYLCHQGQLHCIAQGRCQALQSAIASNGARLALSCSRLQGQLSCLLQVVKGGGGITSAATPSHYGRAVSPTLSALGLAHLYPLDQSQPYCAAKVRYRICSPICCSYPGERPAHLLS